jgi:hypothetical protein
MAEHWAATSASIDHLADAARPRQQSDQTRAPVSVEKFRNRIDASSRATVFEVVQGNYKLLDTIRLPNTDDMRSSRNRTFAFPASAATASGQTRKDTQAESDRDIPSSALGCSPGPLVSWFEFIDPARFYGQVMASGRRPASHAEWIGVL